MPLVPDPSAIAGLAFPDEDSRPALAVIEAIGADLAIVPTLFWFEIRNILLMGERRKRIAPHQTTLFLANLSVLPFEIDSQPHLGFTGIPKAISVLRQVQGPLASSGTTLSRTPRT